MLNEIIQRIVRRSSGAQAVFEDRIDKLAFGSQVLHMGCGSGDLTFDIADVAHIIEGVDGRRDLIKVALQKLAMRGRVQDEESLVGFICRPIVETRLPGAMYDLVFGIDILSGDAGPVAMEAHRVLRTGGTLIALESGLKAHQVGLVENVFTKTTTQHFGAFRRMTLIEATKGAGWA